VAAAFDDLGDVTTGVAEPQTVSRSTMVGLGAARTGVLELHRGRARAALFRGNEFAAGARSIDIATSASIDSWVTGGPGCNRAPRP